ncbi:hypothetical protein ACRALDRAFT_1061396, partial [Sodiomyces alcalophilus JCM 7366]|uniref:uncharacterized protein n=1 Tax=Sodiomyces alcalophilus JCM 7366 TaxID=591952 RepID=UPI0039B5D7D3
MDGSDAESPENASIESDRDDVDVEEKERPSFDATETQQPDSDEEQIVLPTKNIRRPKKNVQIVSDDEEDADGQDVIVEATPKPKTTAQVSPAPPKTDSPAMPTSVLRSAKKTFIPGLPVVGPAGLGLTQIFAGTMDDGSQDQHEQPGTASLGLPMPSPTCGFHHFDVSQDDETQAGDEMILDSQGGADTQKAETQADGRETQGVQLRFTQSQMHGFDSLLRQEIDDMPTQMTIEPTQDVGLQEYTPLRERFIDAPASTAQTVTTSERLLETEDEAEVRDSPLVRRGRRRLRRKLEASDEEPQSTAFGIMKTAAKEKRQKEFLDKKKSKARDMFEEQAEESEDEYAGLGGADGEDSSGDEDSASVKDMIDDEAGKDDDERKNAALYADRERARDEQMVDKLFRDITTGMLRRKRGADYDLSDSDDGGEARRRLKRRQFSKMQKALFADERIKKMAEKPGNQAFLRTIEDRDNEVMDFLDIGPEPMDVDADTSQATSSSSSQEQRVPDSQPQDENRAPLGTAGNGSFANPRRTKGGKKKPSNIGEIRESLSSLLEEPEGSIIPATEVGSDSEAEDDDETLRRTAGAAASGGDKENTSPVGRNRRRTTAAVIDRMTLKRESSSNVSTHSRSAFARPTAGGPGASGFKVPALLRRATTNSISLPGGSGSGAGASVTTTARGSGGGFGDDGVVKKGVGRRSGISALARETERRAAMAQGEKRREAKKWKGAEMRGKAFGGLMGAGKF